MATTLTFEMGRRPGIAPRTARRRAPRLTVAQREALHALIHEPVGASRWNGRNRRDASLFGALAIGLAALIGLTFGYAFDTVPPATDAHVNEAIARAAAPIADLRTAARPAQPSSDVTIRTM
jgi:hypothetical protein